MDSPYTRKNQDIYELTRANLLQSVKGSIFIDNPRYVVHKIDRLFSHQHSVPTREFLKAMGIKLREMKNDFPKEITEFQKLAETLDVLSVYLMKKSEEEDL